MIQCSHYSHQLLRTRRTTMQTLVVALPGKCGNSHSEFGFGSSGGTLRTYLSPGSHQSLDTQSRLPHLSLTSARLTRGAVLPTVDCLAEKGDLPSTAQTLRTTLRQTSMNCTLWSTQVWTCRYYVHGLKIRELLQGSIPIIAPLIYNFSVHCLLASKTMKKSGLALNCVLVNTHSTDGCPTQRT